MPNFLLVDDDCCLLAALRSIILTTGFALQTAGNGADAVAAIRTAAPDVIVADNMMPLMSGVNYGGGFASYPDDKSIPFLFQSAVHELPDAGAAAV
ncbi:response regulator [Paraburkholderia strydomiana]|uniref:response regulator n=1 Tax=Paraburkholderia strydomiana TaxID=1245417 RepID=UPI001BE56AE6|nr:response regulator [Paraburkholderia strydomiana]MBT2790100.1 response regulator [Paraburkholderia strydomiana]